MKKGFRSAPGLLVIGFAGALLLSPGCGGSGDGGTMAPSMSCSDGGPAGENVVTMNCGAVVSGTTEEVEVMFGGPSSGTTTLRGLNFNVNYDATKLEFVPDDNPTSALFPGALVLTVLGNGQQGSVVVAIQQPGTLPDVEVAAGVHRVLSLSFRRVAAATFDPTPLTFDRADATSASAPVSFADGLALGYPQ